MISNIYNVFVKFANLPARSIKMLITITESAKKKISALLKDHDKDALRFGVKSGGCSGFSYEFGFGSLDELDSIDEVEDFGNGIKIIVDGASIMYIIGTQIDWKEDVMGAAFAFSNPKSASSCGCGESFAVSV